MFIFLLAAASLFSPEALDYEMSTQEKKLTGVSKLTDKEKAALQRWIDSRYEKREVAVAKNLAEKHPTLSENLKNGNYLRLSDDTLWEIRPQDNALSQGWITPAEIVITQSGDAQYPSKLTNSITGSSVFAKKVEAVPIQTSRKS